MTERAIKSGFAIVNPDGGIWAPELFKTQQDAWMRTHKHFGLNKTPSGFMVQPATLLVRLDQ